MRPHLFLIAVLATLAAPAAAATRTYTVTGFDRIRVDGPYRVILATGVAPFARAEGSQAALDGVSVEVHGRTLIVRRKSSTFEDRSAASGPVSISAGTHELSAAWLNGPGGLAIDVVKGHKFDLSVSGSGAAEVGRLSVDTLDLSISGSASVALAGSAATAAFAIRGPSALEAAELSVKAAKIFAEGPTRVRLTATDTAKVDAKGLATVELGGGPACTVRPSNSAEVSGCR